jgi:hypothetical protein
MTLVSLPLPAQSPLFSGSVKGSDLPAGISGVTDGNISKSRTISRVEVAGGI